MQRSNAANTTLKSAKLDRALALLPRLQPLLLPLLRSMGVPYLRTSY